ncbi:PH, RCC1 and FYVE domains-containing protein 1 [Glycine soja]
MNSIHNAKDQHVECQHYIETWVKESQREVAHWQLVVLCPRNDVVVWFYSLRKKPNIHIKVAINNAMKTLKTTVDGKNDQGPPKWIEVKSHVQSEGYECGYYFGDGTPLLDLETITTICKKWAAYFVKVLIAMKNGAQLLKYGRKGKPKFCPFRLSRICKDKVEAEVWIAGLKALISSGQGGRSKIDGWSDGGLILNDSRDLTSNSPPSESLDSTSSDISMTLPNTSPKSFRPDNTISKKSHVPPDGTNMQVKGSALDVFRVSVSSAPSTSSHGSAPDDYDALGDVYIWGEVTCENVKVGADKNVNYFSPRADVLLPRPLESNVVLDVHHIACGARHASLVTRQGEVFTWGEESGGCRGHGVGKNVVQPRLVEALTYTTFHSCAVTMAGELYTWGDGTHNVGLLGHGSDASHWIPKRIVSPSEGLQIAFVACGPWYTTLVTSIAQLFTFGDGTFGVLSHGDRQNVSYPREVESLLGLRTIVVTCGVWHTAAVEEIIATHSSTSISSGKLFTWGDGDKNRLGHRDKETLLLFMVSLGILNMTERFHAWSETRLPGESIEEIACRAYHVAVLTSKNEVYTWGKGANGRLGHADVEDRKTPALVEALKDRHVKYIACGSNNSAAICLHKWVSGAEQSQCSTSGQAFGFTRKRHNCYNCGLVHCHSCSSRKALGAAHAPNPGKPYRVCDSCYAKLNKVVEASNSNRRNALPPLSGENKDRLDKSDLRLSKAVIPSNMDLIKQLDTKAAKQGNKGDTFSLLKDVVLSTALDLRRTVPRPVVAPSRVSSRSVSHFSKRPSPPRSATPIPTTSGLAFSKSISDSLKKTNELLNQEVQKLHAQVKSPRQTCELQELEIQRSTKKPQEAMALFAEESAKCKAAKEVIKSLTVQLKDPAEKLPTGVPAYLPNGIEPNGIHHPDSNGEQHSKAESISASSLASMGLEYALLNKTAGNSPGTYGTNLHQQIRSPVSSNGTNNYPDVKLPNQPGPLGPSRKFLEKAVPSRGSNLARLGEPGRAGWQASPSFRYK